MRVPSPPRFDDLLALHVAEPIALVALGTVPVIAGALRLVELSGGTAALPPDARYDATPLPVVLHIVCAAVFAILGAFQFAPRLGRRRPAWHRRAGRVLVLAGLGWRCPRVG